MTQEEISEGNKLIAEFIGYQSGKYPNLPKKLHINKDGEEYGVHQDNLIDRCDEIIQSLPKQEVISKEDMFEFIEWIDSQQYVYRVSFKVWVCLDKRISISDLYQLFLEHKKDKQ